jgi:hypothetical protein
LGELPEILLFVSLLKKVDSTAEIAERAEFFLKILCGLCALCGEKGFWQWSHLWNKPRLSKFKGTEETPTSFLSSFCSLSSLYNAPIPKIFRPDRSPPYVHFFPWLALYRRSRFLCFT